MTPHEIINIQMSYHFDLRPHVQLQAGVQAALNRGEWLDDFDLAVKSGELTDQEAARLLQVILNAYPEHVLDMERMRHIIDSSLPQADLAQLQWLVGPDYALVLTDSLRVGKVTDGYLNWVTQRIAWNGIVLDRIKDGVVLGSWQDATNTDQERQPLRLAYADGSLIEGREINP